MKARLATPQESLPYEPTQAFSARLCGQEMRFVSKPGLPHWNQVTPSTILLAENVTPPEQGRFLWLGCGHGAGAAALARQAPGCELWLMDTSFIALQMSTLTAQENKLPNIVTHASISTLPEQREAFEAVAIDLPKGRKLAQRWLLEAWHALRRGGQLYLAGANEQGIQAVIKDAQAIFGLGTILAYKKGNRVVRFQKSGELQAENVAWLTEPGIAPQTWHELSITVGTAGATHCGKEHRLSASHLDSLSIRSLPGIFSFDHLDEGTRLLLEHMQTPAGGRVVDIGCGYGIIGLLAARAGAAHVDLVDVNLLAVAAAKENLVLHNIANAEAQPADILSALAGKRYNLAVTNPPFHAGASVDYQIAQAFIQQSWRALEDGGQLLLVANRFIRYEQLMQSIFRRVECVAETGRYHLLSGTK
jgi:16S rRNA (guanine1207-N2)-methyltransferase